MSYYDVLPTDLDAVPHGMPNGADWAEHFESLMGASFRAIKQRWLDELAQYLFSRRDWPFPPEQIKALADHISHLYIRALRTSETDVRKKMSLQRVNFFLRSILDADCPAAPEASEVKVGCLCPWDWIEADGCEVYIASARPNVVVRYGKAVWESQLGLPTQIDRISDGTFSLGSHYTDGGYRISGRNVQFVPHQAPIVLQFAHEETEFYLDALGHLCEAGSRKVVTVAPISRVSRARRFGSQLYVISWTVPSVMYVCRLDRHQWHTVSLKDVLLPNDLLRVDDHFYVVDKQQGKIFKYDTDFRLIRTECGFGRGPGRLFDPIAIRSSPDGRYLRVMNWVPCTITTVLRF